MRSNLWQRALTFIRETWRGEVLDPIPPRGTEPDGHPSDAGLIAKAVRNAGYLITDGEVPRWAAVRDTFAVGSSSAFYLCRRFGFNPDEMVGCFVEVEEEERERIGLPSDSCKACGRVSCSFECPARTAIEKELEEGGGAFDSAGTDRRTVTSPPVGKAGGERAPMTVRELIAALSKMNPDKRVCFDTEAALFNVHLVGIHAVYEEEYGLGDKPTDDPVVLHTNEPREYVSDNKEPAAAPCEREAPPVEFKDPATGPQPGGICCIDCFPRDFETGGKCRKPGCGCHVPATKPDAFRPGLPPLELRRVWREWEDSAGDFVTFLDGDRFRWSTFAVGDSEPIDWPDAAWAVANLRPCGATWSHVESLAAAKVAADKQPEESRVRIYCWKVGTAFWRKPNGDCPECGKYGHNHRVLPANECGTFVDCQGKHGHPCVLPPDHEGPHAAPEALAECLHAAGNEMVAK